MAEALGVAARIAGLVWSSTQLIQSLNRRSFAQEIDHGMVNEVKVHAGILGQLGEIPLSSGRELPLVAEDCIRLCHQRLMTLLVKVSTSKKVSSTEMGKALKDFARSVKLLRDVVAE